MLNPKERSRLKARMQELQAFPLDTPEHASARRRIAQKFNQEDVGWERRCRSVIAKGVVPITVDSSILEYSPSTGAFVWIVHPSKQGQNALLIRNTGQRYIPTREGVPLAAARLAYEAVHGSVPDTYDVYCVNNDPGDLRIKNIRAVKVNRATKVYDPEQAKLVLEELAKIRAAKSQL